MTENNDNSNNHNLEDYFKEIETKLLQNLKHVKKEDLPFEIYFKKDSLENPYCAMITTKTFKFTIQSKHLDAEGALELAEKVQDYLKNLEGKNYECNINVDSLR